MKSQQQIIPHIGPMLTRHRISGPVPPHCYLGFLTSQPLVTISATILLTQSTQECRRVTSMVTPCPSLVDCQCEESRRQSEPEI